MLKNLIPFLLTVLPFAVFADHASISLAVGSAAPIATESGLTMPQGSFSSNIRSELIRLDEYSDSKLQALREADEDADLHSVESLWSISAGAAYAITDDFTLGFRLPFIMRDNIREPAHGHDDSDEPDHHHDEPAEIESLGNVEGIGDLTVFGQYRFFQNKGIHVSALFGIKAPTGKTNRHSANGEELLETEFQPGSGSWDGIMGFALTQQFDAFSIAASTVYTVTSEGTQETDLGDIFSYNAALSYRLFGSQGLSYQTPKFALDTILEINGEWRDQEQTYGKKDNNSGGNVIYISPGLRITASKYINLGASFGIPIVRDTNGDQVEPDYRIISSINVNF
ncbi:MAG: transporter [Methylococcales symbiont of Hymedesmia sp. n. MRB-2018]|nr:MAG: transporter [Methylococcales symbiont of Hymedesmia sp. n. MRB-2018]